jgi:hypothetical protein
MIAKLPLMEAPIAEINKAVIKLTHKNIRSDANYSNQKYCFPDDKIFYSKERKLNLHEEIRKLTGKI